MSPFGHQMRALVPATAHIPSFGATVLTGPTHPVPSFKPFFTLVGSANAEVHERTKAAASSTRHILYLERRSLDGATPRVLQSVSKTLSSLAMPLFEHRRRPIYRYGLNATVSYLERGYSVEAFESQATFGNSCMDEFALVFRQLVVEELGIPADIGPQGLDTGGPHVHVITLLGRSR